MIEASSGSGRRSGLGGAGQPVPRPVEIPTVAGHDVDVRIGFENRDLFRQELALPPVVAVEQGEKLAARRAQRGVPRTGKAAIGLLDQTNPRVLFRKLFGDRRRVVLGTVIDHDQFEVCIGLRQRGTNRFADVRGDVVRRHDDAYGRHGTSWARTAGAGSRSMAS